MLGETLDNKRVTTFGFVGCDKAWKSAVYGGESHWYVVLFAHMHSISQVVSSDSMCTHILLITSSLYFQEEAAA